MLYIKENGQNFNFKWPKMAKNGPNDLNFGPGVYFNGFYQIPKNL